jgi:hypothetical protein
MNAHSEFECAIQEIIRGAEQFRKVCESEADATYQEPDSESTFVRVPVGAFCLKLAYKVWQDLQYSKRGQLGLTGIGAGFPGKQFVKQVPEDGGKTVSEKRATTLQKTTLQTDDEQ